MGMDTLVTSLVKDRIGEKVKTHAHKKDKYIYIYMYIYISFSKGRLPSISFHVPPPLPNKPKTLWQIFAQRGFEVKVDKSPA